MATMKPAAPVTGPSTGRGLAVAVLLGGLGVAVVVTLLGLTTYGLPGSYESTPFGDLGAFVFEATLLWLGYVLRTRRPENALGWLFLVFGLCATFSHVAWATMQLSYLPGGDRNVGAAVSWLGAVGSILTWTYLMTSLVIRFPDGRPDSRGEARMLRWLPLFCVVAAGGAAIRPGPLLIFPAFDNPISTPPALDGLLTTASTLALLAVLIPTVVSGRAIIRRYRGATTTERLQLRWFAFGATLSLTATAIYLVFGVILAPEDHVIREGTYALFVAALASMPIAVFQAIATHRLYDIDRIIGRTLAYGALTAILAGLYSASIRLFNWLFVDLTGQQSEVALVLTTLILATSFTPIKAWLEKGAAKRFKLDQAPAPVGSDTPGATAAPFTAEQQAYIDARIEAAVRASR
ncbi:MAG TPA: hypothetical protein VIF63_09275 [Candidatus Limnocylindrales bacterium]|jgi:hypothetical protein